jgi:mannitol/fructose-specific phosphotransferase system IIA component (Ntr-type)
MTELNKDKAVTLEELMVSTLAMADAVAKLLIEKGVISEAEFKEQLLKERAKYQTLLQNANPH